MTILAFDWATAGIKAAQFVLSFSILVVLHELGHFLPARWFKCRVEKFYLFFNPWFSLVKKKIGETEYGLGWIPFGGYVKISGMIDESMDKEQLKLPPQPYEFRAKPAWQRLIIMLGGVTVNVLLAIIIFIGIMWHWGEKYIPIENLKYGLYTDSLGDRVGLKDGDRVIAVAGKKIERVGTLGSEIILNEAKILTVERDGKTFELQLPTGFINQLNKNKLGGFTYIRTPVIIDSVLEKAVITNGKLLKGDKILTVNDSAAAFNNIFYKALKRNAGKTIAVTALRNDKDTVKATVFIDTKYNTNIVFSSADEILGTKEIGYTFLEAIPAGIKKCFSTLGNYVSNLRLLFTSKEVKVNDSLGSVISIGGIFPSVWDWQSFWTLTAIFSIILAFMNILPIPALDGGHALFTIVEMITGRKPGDKFMEYAQTVGMVLLLGLMAYALGLDFLRLFTKS